MIKSSREGEAQVIRVAGELDLFELPRLECALDEAEAIAAERVLLDLES